MTQMTFENFQEFVNLTYEGVKNQFLYREEINKMYKMLQDNDYEVYLVQNKMNDFSFAFKKQDSDEILGTIYLRPDRFVLFNGQEEDNHEKIQVRTLENGMFERKYDYVVPMTSEELAESKPELVDETVEGSQLTHTVQSHEIYNRSAIIVYQKTNNIITNEDNGSVISAKTTTAVVDDSYLNASIKADACGFVKTEDLLAGEIQYYTIDKREYNFKSAVKIDSTEPGSHTTMDIFNNMLACLQPETDKNIKHYADEQIKNAIKIHGSSIQAE